MSTPASDPQAPDRSAIRAALGRIFASRGFSSAPMLTSFLQFVVEATIEGEGGRLKGYTIGVGALGRSANFDPQIDPIVRVEASRLRTALARYYAGPGIDDPVIIAIPRGHYVANFAWARRSAPRAMWKWACSALQRLLAA